ncbi:MAG: PilN domain-containing protein [Phycisphaerae bacterium]|nr:PilN domain-containing protein [Phycisphaerae bacterium]MDW8260922.1 PilN domain-containing protein [Phycisphaerales bacterium]
MRELEFLPEWYPILRRRRGLAVTQAWVTAVLMAALCLVGVAEHRRVMAYEATSTELTAEMNRTRAQLRMLDEQLELKKQLEQQSLILSKVGLQVDISRLLGEIAHLMSRETFLLEFRAETEETVRPSEKNGANNSRSRADTRSGNAAEDAPCDRKLRVKLVCVAPSDVDVANFLAGLTNKPFLEQVAMTYAKDRTQSGRVMREFEITFQVNLNTPSAE